MAGNKTVTLADVPGRPIELEEYVAALFQSARYFVEKQVIEREPAAEILELDAVATSYDGPSPVSVIVEAKSGSWGFADIFKVRGWMTYLDIDQGAFFASKIVQKDNAFVQDKCAPMGVRFVHLGDFTDARERFAGAGFPIVEDEKRLTVWRLSYWAERNLISKLRQHARTSPDSEGSRAVLDYLHLTNNGIFFTPDVRMRLGELYEAFQTHPRLSLGVAMEQAGGSYDPHAVDPTNVLIRQAMLEGSHPVIQGAFYAEHRARLAILKAAVDHEVAVDAGKIPVPEFPKLGQPISLKLSDLRYWALPQSFREGLDTLKKHKAFRHYPLFWQVFLWGFGGFFLLDKTEQEFGWLAEQTGVPVDEIPNALKAYDILFPQAGKGWFNTPGTTNTTVLKMVPMPLRGLGAVHRRMLYDVPDYHALGYKNYTGNDMTRWHNSLIDLLLES